MAKIDRTAKGLRDALFDEIDSLRTEDADPQRSMAVAKIAGQIINIARAEMEFNARMNKDDQLCDDFMTGQLKLGGNVSGESKKSVSIEGAVSARDPATGR